MTSVLSVEYCQRPVVNTLDQTYWMVDNLLGYRCRHTRNQEERRLNSVVRPDHAVVIGFWQMSPMQASVVPCYECIVALAFDVLKCCEEEAVP